MTFRQAVRKMREAQDYYQQMSHGYRAGSASISEVNAAADQVAITEMAVDAMLTKADYSAGFYILVGAFSFWVGHVIGHVIGHLLFE